MADRTVYGLTHSENGWRMVDQGSCVWVTVPGTDVTLQIREGQPAKILAAFAADFNAHVEPLRDRDSACWTPTNSVASSNHLSGTAMDLNWDGADGKTFRFQIPEERAYPPPKNARVRELLDFYEDMVFCGGFWDIGDWMHFQMGGDTYGSQNVDKVNDFIRRKIRADGFSTFKRGAGAPPVPPPPPAGNAADVLARATGLSLGRATEILPTMRQGLKAAECTNPNRIAMFIAQTGHESANFERTEEYASGAAYEGRADLGNTQPGDGVRFKGRTWIQITGRHNYGEFSEWAHSKGLVPTPTYFTDHPVELQELKWAGTGAAWYWTVARGTRINEASDKRDLVTVTQLINGGQNGIEDRRARYNRALAVGDALTQILTEEDDELADPAIVKKINELHAALMSPKESRSIYAEPNEGARWPWFELLENGDKFNHERYVEDEARAGNLAELARVVRTAQGQGKFKDPVTVQKAQRVIAEIEATNPAILQQYLRGTANV